MQFLRLDATHTCIKGESFTNSQKSGGNLLGLFYQDSERWAYTFQTYAFLSRMKSQMRHDVDTTKPVTIFERSVVSDRVCFAKNCNVRNSCPCLRFPFLSLLLRLVLFYIFWHATQGKPAGRFDMLPFESKALACVSGVYCVVQPVLFSLVCLFLWVILTCANSSAYITPGATRRVRHGSHLLPPPLPHRQAASCLTWSTSDNIDDSSTLVLVNSRTLTGCTDPFGELQGAPHQYPLGLVATTSATLC